MKAIVIVLMICFMIGGIIMFGIRDPNKKGVRLLERGDYQNAIIEFKRVLAKNPQNWQTYGYLGDTYRRLGQEDKAIDSYKRSLSYNPEAIESYEGLALSYADKGIKFNEAIALLEKTREILRDDTSVLNQTRSFYLEALSWVYFQKGDITRAIACFDEAYPLWQKDFQSGVDQFDPYFSKVHYHFGVLLSHKGEKEKAYKEFEKAIQSGQSSAFAKRAQQKKEKLK